MKKDHFYHGLCPYLHDALSFAMAELPKREQAHPTFDTLYTLAKKLEAGKLACTRRYTPTPDVYREKHRCYPASAGRVAALEEEGQVSTDPVSGEDSESEVEVVDGLNMHLAQAMSCYQREEQKCFVCVSTIPSPTSASISDSPCTENLGASSSDVYSPWSSGEYISPESSCLSESITGTQQL